MSNEFGHGRRRFLFTLAGVGGAAALGGGVWSGLRTRERALAAHFAEVLGDLEAARKIGRIHLEANPNQGQLAEITRLLDSDLAPAARALDLVDLRRRVGERVRLDYADGRVAQVKGWVLSVTEIRLCSLAAIITPAV